MIAFIAFVLSIVLANWSLDRYGLIDVGPWLVPAGTFWAGLTFTFRDLVHDRWTWRGAVLAVVVGAALSWFVAPSFAAASGLAFLVSEGLDLAVYAPLRRRRWLLAVALSNTVGLVVDSVLFLWLAFDVVNRAALEGQIVVKGLMTVLAVAFLWAWRQRDLSERVRTGRSAGGSRDHLGTAQS
jgi:uncharacterized PurR-regulated membrane protein YhhQ (DUF165 family)